MNAAATPVGYPSRLTARHEVADRTLLLEFARPFGFDFVAGQFMDLTLLAPGQTDPKGDTRAFSISSAPHEEALKVTTRLTNSAFKRNLATMPIGSEVSIMGPSGDLTLEDDPSRPVVILAGGIGITPFRSIVLDAAYRRLSHRIFLFYANRRPEDAPFLEELRALERVNSRYTFVPTMTQAEQSDQGWAGERVRIDRSLISRHVDDPRRPTYYVAGPPSMVRGLTGMLSGSGVDSQSIRAEEFDGY